MLTTYARPRNFSLQGGFAKCFEFIDQTDNKSYACKVISKSQLVKDKHKTKVYHFSIAVFYVFPFASYMVCALSIA